MNDKIGTMYVYYSAVQQILKKCPKAANKQKSDGYTALHLAACMDYDEIAKVLLQNVILKSTLQTLILFNLY
jgi:ankyrin repeat protein